MTEGREEESCLGPAGGHNCQAFDRTSTNVEGPYGAICKNKGFYLKLALIGPEVWRTDL